MNKKIVLLGLLISSMLSSNVFALTFLCPVRTGDTVKVTYQDTMDPYQRTYDADVMAGCWPVTNTKPAAPITVVVVQINPAYDHNCSGIINKTQFDHYYCAKSDTWQYLTYLDTSVINETGQAFGTDVGTLQFVFPHVKNMQVSLKKSLNQ